MHQIGNTDAKHICHGYSVLLAVANVSAYLLHHCNHGALHETGGQMVK